MSLFGIAILNLPLFSFIRLCLKPANFSSSVIIPILLDMTMVTCLEVQDEDDLSLIMIKNSIPVDGRTHPI